tara:strand:- start:1197 stop:1466 length:270 start_codon:yes stop_codon:yes gene_type:complete
MKKKQVRKRKPSIYYKTEMVKKGKDIVWRAVEMPSKIVIKESFFEEDVKPVVKFQNKNKTFGIFGFPPFFDCRDEAERISDKGKSRYIR